MRYSVVLVLCALLVSGCATQGRGNTTIGIDDSRFNKTMVGALAGAAGGATIGAVAADDAAAGVAIGAISGGIIGAGIGAVLAKNDAENDSLNEKSYQQQEKIKQQERDINYLRSRDADKKPPPKSSSADDGVGEENLPLLPPAEGSEPAGKSTPPAARTTVDDPPAVEIPKAAEPTARGSLSEKYPYSDARPSGSRQSRSVAGEELVAAGAVVGTTAVVASKTAGDNAGGLKEVESKSADPKLASAKSSAKAAPTRVEPAKADTVKSEIAPTLKKVEPATPAATSVTPPPGQAGCKEAVKEAERGLKSSSDADRLFYLRRASRLCPSEPTYHVELGRMLSSLGKNNEAKQELKHALTLDPKNQIARDELSILENSSGRK